MGYRFGGFTLDEATRELHFKGGKVHLTPKAFDLLHLLVQNRARAVSKVELQQRLWPSTFVEETNLASLVTQIRHGLRDTAANPRFVRTVYGFGYQFVGEVTANVGATRSEESHPKLWLMFERRQIPLMEGVNVLGRAPDAAIQIDSPGVSRYHARILVADGEATLEDLGSKNGTDLNGNRLTTPRRLSDGNEVRLGAVILTFRITSPTSLTETVPGEGA
jgi:DNA-binding winged helix-turn-helix (wHTH) protein